MRTYVGRRSSALRHSLIGLYKQARYTLDGRWEMLLVAPSPGRIGKSPRIFIADLENRTSKPAEHWAMSLFAQPGRTILGC